MIALIACPLVVLATLGISYSLGPRQTAHIATPPADATPEQVVTAYVEALNAHDCHAAKSLTVENATYDAATWCDDAASLTSLHVQHRVMESSAVADVPVTFNLDWRLFRDDGSMDEGVTDWGYRSGARTLGLPVAHLRPGHRLSDPRLRRADVGMSDTLG